MRAVSFLHICSNQFILLLGSQRSFFSSSPPPPFFWFSPLLTAPCPNTQVHSRSLRLHLILCCIWNLKMAYFFRTLYILMFTILIFWEMISLGFTFVAMTNAWSYWKLISVLGEIATVMSILSGYLSDKMPRLLLLCSFLALLFSISDSN